MKVTYEIPEVKKGSFYETIEKANKKAKKLGLNALNVIENSVMVQKEVPITEIFEGKEYISYKIMNVYSFTVTGETPKIDGFKLIGLVEFIDKMKPVTHSFVDDNDQLALLKVNDHHCDHCQTNRMRNKVFLIKNTENNEFIQVGKSCLTDFFPQDVFNKIVSFEKIFYVFKELDTLMEGGNYHNPKHILIKIEEILALSIEAINQYGFVSTKNEGEGNIATSTLVKSQYGGQPIVVLDINEEKINQAKLLLADNQNILNQYFDNNINTFNNNLQNFVEVGFVNITNIGLVSFLPVLISKLNQPKTESNYIGTIKEKITVKATLTNVYGFETAYGYTNLYNFLDEQGNKLSWFNTGKKPDCQVNDVVTLTGTVKDHNLYKGEKQTVLVRCKITKNS